MNRVVIDFCIVVRWRDEVRVIVIIFVFFYNYVLFGNGYFYEVWKF